MKLLTILKETNGYVSGEQLGDILGMTRAGVWKALKHLKEQGYEIESIPNKGYKFISAPDILTEDELTYKLPTKSIGQTVMYYKEIDSTNDKAKEIAVNHKEGTVVVADVQTKGKGRRGKSFYSLDDKSIYASLILKPDITPEKASVITLAIGLAIAYAIENTTGLKADIKWPNDLLIDGKKICGILTEMSAEMDKINYIVVGFGINVNNDHFPEELQNIATSLQMKLKKQIARKMLLKEIFIQFENIYYKTILTNDFESLITSYKPFCVTLNKHITATRSEKSINGKAVDINDKGELLVTLDNGQAITLFSGDVSIR